MSNMQNHGPCISARSVQAPEKVKAKILKLRICLCPAVHLLETYACPNHELMVCKHQIFQQRMKYRKSQKPLEKG